MRTAPRTVLVTGGSAGIGQAAALGFAGRGDEVVLLGRNPARLASAASKVREATGVTPATFRADFAVLDEVRSAAEQIADRFEKIHVLANNAGGLALWQGLTVDGHDVTMQVNHLGGFLLCHLLLDRMVAAATPEQPARLITTASLAEAWGWLNVDRPLRRSLPHRSRWLAYGSSKQANVLFTIEAARRWVPLGILPTCYFPGLVRSRFASTSPMFMLSKLMPFMVFSPRWGADTMLWLANTPPEQLIPGGYYFMRNEFAATPRATSPDRAARLWRASAAALGIDDAATTSPPATPRPAPGSP